MNLVLVPGILGFQRIGPVSYFNGIAEHLRAAFLQYRVLATTTQPLGTIERRAQLLASQLREAFSDGRLDSARPLHLLAHSMGGLDSRYLIRNIGDLAPRVATLVCIGTPHRGTPLASSLGPQHTLHSLRDLFGLHGALIEELRARTGAVPELTAESMGRFNLDCPDSVGVRYLNVAAIGRDALFPTATLFAPTHLYLSAVSGRNDGVVPFASAAGGRGDVISWPADHADLIGHDLDLGVGGQRPAFDCLGAYEGLVRMLA